MDGDRWQQIKVLFDAALELSPKKRESFLENACGGDAELRVEVEKLLASSARADRFMERPAVAEVASLIVEPGDQLRSGQRIAHYEIIRQLGVGGMGEVYLARDTRLSRKVALKVLPAHLTADKVRLERFKQEARAASALNHPSIITIHEIDTDGDTTFITTEYVEGETLRQRMSRGDLNVAEALDVTAHLASALAVAHAAGVVHRDIKPENVMLRPDGIVKLLDFGLAKLTETDVAESLSDISARKLTTPGVVLGTISYMSPEQAQGAKVDHRTDLWSLGVVLYEMLAGSLPFSGKTVNHTLVAIMEDAPAPLSHRDGEAPAELERAVTKLLAKEPDARYQTANDLLSDLRELRKQLERGEPVTFVSASAKLIEQPSPVASIAILPFSTLALKEDDEYLGLGLADALITQLSNTKKLAVRPTSAIRRYHNPEQNSGSIGRELRVGTILEGSLQRAGERLRVTVQLVSVETGNSLWAGKFNASLTDIFDVQDEIAAQVVGALLLNLSSSEHQRLKSRWTENAEAYQFYLKGRYHYLKLRPEEIQTGISYFQKAIELDSSYALAYVGLAQAFLVLPLATEQPANEFFPKAKEAALRAIEIDDRLAEAHGVLGWLLFWFDWDWKASENECQRAFELDPNSADTHEAYAHLLSNTGRHAEALAEIKRAKDLDPLNLRINALEGQFLLHAGKPDEALAQLHNTFELEPNFWLTRLFAASVYIEKEMFAEAAAEANKAKQLSGGSSHAAALVIYALAQSGEQAEAEATLKELQLSSNARYVPPYHFALACQGLNRRDETFEYLASALEQRDPKLTFLKVEPKWNNLRADPRFQDVLRRVGLAA